MSARKRVRKYLKERQEGNDVIGQHPPPADDVVDLLASDLRALLLSERAARHTARRVISEKLELQRKLREQGDAASRAVQKYRTQADTIDAMNQRVQELSAENTALRNTVSELSKKISDPPGSHDLRTSLLRAEEQIRTQAETIEQQARKLVRLKKEEEVARQAQEALANIRAAYRKDSSLGLLRAVAAAERMEKKK